MDEERIFALMMDALDGVLDDRESAEFADYLAQRPDLQREWESMQTIDSLLRAAPPAATPMNFVSNTMSRLPDPRSRRLFLTVFYLLLLLGGALPIVFGVVLSNQLGGVFAAGQPIGQLLSIIQVVIGGLFSSLSSLLASQPLVFGWLSLMVAAILVWLNVFRQMSSQAQPVPVQMAVRS